VCGITKGNSGSPALSTLKKGVIFSSTFTEGVEGKKKGGPTSLSQYRGKGRSRPKVCNPIQILIRRMAEGKKTGMHREKPPVKGVVCTFGLEQIRRKSEKMGKLRDETPAPYRMKRY